ncbi:MAG: SDR family oxidoreductase [Pseudomonadota bacterium]
MSNVMIIGATSAIAEETARIFAQRGDRLFLVARNAERLALIANDLKIRGAAVTFTETMDVTRLELHRDLITKAQQQLGSIDVVLIAHGSLPDQRACEQDAELALREFNTNGLSVISLLTHLANAMEAQGRGVIAAISSVAGDRGRQSNYVYGAAKGAVSVFLQGLRNRLVRKGVHVVTVKPGFVDTPMTAQFKKGLLWAKPHVIARGIYNAIEERRNVVYLPWFWWGIMAVIKSIPESIFKKLSL